MSRIEVITCDYCGETLKYPEVDARGYGVEFHLACLMKMSVSDFIYLLGVDDIRVNDRIEVFDENKGVKINSYVRRNKLLSLRLQDRFK